MRVEDRVVILSLNSKIGSQNELIRQIESFRDIAAACYVYTNVNREDEFVSRAKEKKCAVFADTADELWQLCGQQGYREYIFTDNSYFGPMYPWTEYIELMEQKTANCVGIEYSGFETDEHGNVHPSGIKGYFALVRDDTCK